MLHSGSRGIGNAIGTYFIEMAQKDMEQHIANLPSRDLAYFSEGSEHFVDYVRAVSWAQDYARANREAMLENVLLALRKTIDKPFTLVSEAINCHHNYVQKEQHFGKEIYVTRKGRYPPGAVSTGLFRDRWARKALLFADSVTQSRSVHAATAPDA